jgi:hypothetical protein
VSLSAYLKVPQSGELKRTARETAECPRCGHSTIPRAVLQHFYGGNNFICAITNASREFGFRRGRLAKSIFRGINPRKMRNMIIFASLYRGPREVEGLHALLCKNSFRLRRKGRESENRRKRKYFAFILVLTKHRKRHIMTLRYIILCKPIALGRGRRRMKNYFRRYKQ